MTEINPQNGEQGPSDLKVEKIVPEVLEEISKVGASAHRNKLFFVALIAGFAFMCYNLIIPQLFPPIVNDTPVIPKPKKVVTPNQEITDIPPIPQLPDPPKLIEPTKPLPEPVTPPVVPKAPAQTSSTPPDPKHADAHPASAETTAPPAPLAPPIQAPAALPSDILGDNQEAEKRRKNKLKSSIVLIAGNDTNMTETEKEQADSFKLRGPLEYLLGRGKIIEAIVETAINTDFGGEVRAVISRDIYAENGKSILIPKGSRAFGSYPASIGHTYGRIEIVWNRIDIPSGYSITINSKAVDNLGRTGANGQVDNKYQERIANAVLLSVAGVAISSAVDKVIPPPVNNQASANQQALVNNMRSVSMASFADPNKSSAQKFADICASVRNVFMDKTDPNYVTINNQCIAPQVGTTDDQRLTNLMTTINTTSDSLVATTQTLATASATQTAAKEGVKNVMETMKGLINDTKLQPTITIDQGTKIHIYVNKDYIFPKAAVHNSRVIK